MRGRSTTWTRIRVNLSNVPEDIRPEQEPLEVDYDPWAEFEWPDRAGQLERAPRKRRALRLTRCRSSRSARRWVLASEVAAAREERQKDEGVAE